MLLSRRMNGRNDQEERWNKMRSVVCSDVINSLAFAMHNGRPQRYAVLPKLEILAWSFAIYLFFFSLHLSLPNLPLFSFQIPIQFAHQRKLTNTLHESIDMHLCQESTLLPSSSLSVCLPASHFFTRVFPLQRSAALRSHPIWVASQGTQIMCPFVNCLEIDTTVSALTRPVILY